MVKKNGTAGADKIYGTQSFDQLFGHSGNDYLSGRGGNDRLEGGAGTDRIDGGSGHDLIYGDAGNDTLHGGTGNDRLFGGVGNDLLHGEAGHDRLWGGEGYDRLWGGDGNDWLTGGNGKASGDGANALYGGAGNDTILFEQYGLAQAGNSILDGGAGKDTLHVVAPGTILSSQDEWGTPGGLTIQLGFGTNSTSDIRGLYGDFAEVYNEIKLGTMTGFERITADDRSHLVYTGSDASTTVEVVGGKAQDVFWFGDGNEVITGGAGPDFFNIDADRVGADGNLGRDIVTDFQVGVDAFTVLDLPPEEGFVFKQQERQFDGKGGIDTVVNIYGPGGNGIQELVLLDVTGLPNIQATSNDWWS